jgi:hypothetical protein
MQYRFIRRHLEVGQGNAALLVNADPYRQERGFTGQAGQFYAVARGNRQQQDRHMLFLYAPAGILGQLPGRLAVFMTNHYAQGFFSR